MGKGATLKVLVAWLGRLILLAAAGFGSSPAVAGTRYADLEVVHPVQACADLVHADLLRAVGAPVSLQIPNVLATDKGTFCKVVGQIAPTIGFEVDLPTEHWTQRFLLGGCGGLCGMRAVGISNASGCAPALNGEFVVAGDDMGHEARMGGPDEAAFAKDPQKRIDFAYRANHLTALAAKALIRAYYGRPARYAYFMGCSDGGREALIEAQRFPDDFDGVSAGDPAALFTVQNSFYHAWNVRADQGEDGLNILMPAKRRLVHDAVVRQCDTLSGVRDGLLQDPRSCRFQPASLACAVGAADTSRCLTPQEVGVVDRLYRGAGDDHCRVFIFGAMRGSEAQWGLPNSPTGSSMSAGMAAHSIGYVILPTVDPGAADLSKFRFDAETAARMAQLAPLYNATNTDLAPFARHGDKLILWHGWSDTSITPGVSIAYYQGVQRFLGAAATDRFMRLFLLPGVGHCGGGDGYDQVDLLSPLMAWTELGQAPGVLITGKPAHPRMPPDGPPSAGPPKGGPPPPGPGGMSRPVAAPPEAIVATRPVFPYPEIARYDGRGDPNVAASYRAAPSPVPSPTAFPPDAVALIGPDNQKDYRVVNGVLTPVGPATGGR